jgi:RNA polymerase sigma-70 factor (ECF subfamily)
LKNGVVTHFRIAFSKPAHHSSRVDEPHDRCDTAASSFPVTRWTVIVSAQGRGAEAELALNDLCGLYWQPVYAFLRRKGNSPADSEDLTQGFFAELLSRGSLETVAAEKGRLRTFLLKAVTRHMVHEYEKSRAAKRGGGQALLSLDFERAEGNYHVEPGHSITPELEFERQWALQLLDHALAEARSEAERNGRGALFEDLKGLISLDATMVAYDEIAKRHGLSEGAVKAAAHRLRQSFRAALRNAIAQTVATEAEIDDEIRHLFEVFQSR